MRAHVYPSCTRIYAQIVIKFDTLAHKIVIDYHNKFHEDPSFRWGDFLKTILVFFNRWFSMYFSYFPNYAPPKPSDMDNYWILMNFFWNYISKCTYLMNKRTPVSVYRLFSSLSNKQILFDSFKETPCSCHSNAFEASPECLYFYNLEKIEPQ